MGVCECTIRTLAGAVTLGDPPERGVANLGIPPVFLTSVSTIPDTDHAWRRIGIGFILAVRMAPRGPNRWFFDLWSQIYDFPLVQRATYRPVHEAVLRTLRESRCHRVLDVGCGTGQLATRIHDVFPRACVVGCDFSAGMLQRAVRRRRRGAWVRGDAARLPFAGAVFDAVVSTEAFHWFPDQDAALAEFFRVLVPGGRVLLALVNTPAEVVSRLAYAGSRLAGEPFYWPTTDQVRRRFEAAGFEVIEQRRVFRLPGFLLPPVLTQAVRPQAAPLRAARSRS